MKSKTNLGERLIDTIQDFKKEFGRFEEKKYLLTKQNTKEPHEKSD